MVQMEDKSSTSSVSIPACLPSTSAAWIKNSAQCGSRSAMFSCKVSGCSEHMCRHDRQLHARLFCRTHTFVDSEICNRLPPVHGYTPSAFHTTTAKVDNELVGVATKCG